MLHHLDLSYALPELRRILAPGGRILAVEALDYNPAIKLYRRLTPAMRTEWEKAHILGIAAPHLGPLAPVVHAVDRVLEKVPYAQRLSWIFTFELLKAED